jgi:phospholipase/carboxylesterase
LNREGIVEAPVADLKIFQVHGARDWMFPVEKARLAASALKNAGANIVYREVEDLSHNYPRDLNAEILDWFTRSGSDLH